MKYSSIDGQILKEMIISGAYELENNKDLVNALNVFPVPDGDTGTNMSATMMSAVDEVKKVKDVNVQSIADAVAMGALMGARGNSGVILSQLMRGLSRQLKGKTTVNTKEFASALKEGANTAYRAVMKPTEGTILTVARETADRAIEIAKTEEDYLVFFEKLYLQSMNSLERTPNMLPVLKQAGVVDAGGKGLACIYNGMLKRLKGEAVELIQGNAIPKVVEVEFDDIDLGEIEFGYCTEFFIKTQNADIDKFKNVIVPFGDSVVVVGTENLIKVHIHTNDPGTVLQEALKLGELSKIKIDNMREQHRNVMDNDSDEEELSVVAEEKEYGMITVAMGDGIKSILEELGVDVVIEGGQTMNPSTHDILNAISKINAKNIFIMPNNGNIIMAAQQAKEISDKNVYVIPTKSIPQGITAIITLNPDDTPDVNEANILEAISNVKTGQITFAVRNTTFDDIEIKEGNILGMINGKLVNVGEGIEEVTKEIIDSMVNEDSELITIFYGNNLSEEDANKIEEYVSKTYKDCDVSVNYGGQPLYYYLISVE